MAVDLRSIAVLAVDVQVFPLNAVRHLNADALGHVVADVSA